MIPFLIILAAITVIVIVGQPHSDAAVYTNRTMLMIIVWCIVYAIAVHLFGLAPVSEWVK